MPKKLFLDPYNPPGDDKPVFAEEPDCVGKCNMFLFEDAIGKIVFIIVIQDRHRSLEDDGAAIQALVHEVHRASRNLHAMENGLALGMQAGETREQRRVDVHHP